MSVWCNTEFNGFEEYCSTYKSHKIVQQFNSWLLCFPIFFRDWEQQTTILRLLHTTPCWCLTTRVAAPPLALSAPSTPPAQETRTMTTSMTGAPDLRSWLTCTEEGMMIKFAQSHAYTHTHTRKHTSLSRQLACHALTPKTRGYYILIEHKITRTCSHWPTDWPTNQSNCPPQRTSAMSQFRVLFSTVSCSKPVCDWNGSSDFSDFSLIFKLLCFCSIWMLYARFRFKFLLSDFHFFYLCLCSLLFLFYFFYILTPLRFKLFPIPEGHRFSLAVSPRPTLWRSFRLSCLLCLRQTKDKKRRTRTSIWKSFLHEGPRFILSWTWIT